MKKFWNLPKIYFHSHANSHIWSKIFSSFFVFSLNQYSILIGVFEVMFFSMYQCSSNSFNLSAKVLELIELKLFLIKLKFLFHWIIERKMRSVHLFQRNENTFITGHWIFSFCITVYFWLLNSILSTLLFKSSK